MTFTLVLISLYGSYLSVSYSQQRVSTNTQRLMELSNEFETNYTSQRTEAKQWAKTRDLPILRSRADGSKFELQRLQHNWPVYYMTMNLNAARTVSADRVWPGGDAGLNLTGLGVTIGHWDGGGVRTTHQELRGRAIQKDSPGSTDYHATHVAGTLIAKGIVPNARGMASSANLISYDWNNDFSEMAAEAANGLLFSNHSYGNITGWYYDYLGDGRWAWFGNPSISQTEDYHFGFYDEEAYYFDNITYNAPYYLIVKSAGNDRDDDGPSAGEFHWYYTGSTWMFSTAYRDQDGGADGYDCISAGGGIAKNTLVIGAIYDITSGYNGPATVQLTTYSSWGPTDDGRIKPDLVANGNSLYSSSNSSDAAYESLSGTSMSSPNVCGSLALLQEHYKNIHGHYMKASTLKGLVIHTADEAGASDGPDYQHGWGLLNVKKAALQISEDQLFDNTIQEQTLMNDQSFTYNFSTDGSAVRATISWTDPPHSAYTPALNPRTPALVNDLDLVLIETSTNTTFLPWVLNINNPAAAAMAGINSVDNTEQVYIANPIPGNYTLSITHKGTLKDGSQDFSLIISGSSVQIGCVPPDIAVKDTSGTFGSVATFEILIEECTKEIDAFGFKLDYDPKVLRYVQTRRAGLSESFEYLEGSVEDSNTIIVGGFNTVPIPAQSNGTIVAIDFEVICSTCNDGDVSSVSLFNLVDDIRSLNICDGTFTFIACPLGDVNGDYSITPQDALCAFKIYLNSGMIPQDFEECDNPCALQASDVTCSQGEITPQDALCILRAYLNHENPPLQCCPDMSNLTKTSGDIKLTIPDVTTTAGQIISVRILCDNYDDVDAFGFDIGYAKDMMAFKSFRPGDLTDAWEFVDVRENVPGVLTIGGFNPDRDVPVSAGVLIELTFLIKNSPSCTTELYVFNLKDDLTNAYTSNGNITVMNGHGTQQSTIPAEYFLAQNYPNPFNPETEIRYDIPEETFVTLAIYNSIGQKIITIVAEEQRPGSYVAHWHGLDETGRQAPSGIYFYRLSTAKYEQINKMVLIR